MRSRTASYSIIWIAVFLLSASFLSLPDVEGIDYGRYTTISKTKFYMHLVAFSLINLVLLYNIRIIRIWTKQNVMYTMYVSYLLLSVVNYTIIYGEIDIVIFARWLDLAMMVPLIFIFMIMNYDEGLRLIFWATFVPIIVIFILLLFSPELAWRPIYLFGTPSTPRLGGNIIPPNTLGGMAALAFLAVFSIRMKRAARVIILPFIISSLILSQSRGAIFCLILAVIASALFHPKKKYKKLIFSGLMLIISAVVIYFNTSHLSSNIPERMFHEVSSFGGRLELWESSLKILVSSGFNELLFGYGLGLPKLIFSTGNLDTRSLHNGYLQVLIGSGLISFAFYVATLFFTVIYRKEWSGSTFTHNAIAIFNIIWCVSELGAGVKLNIFTLFLAFLLANAGRAAIYANASFLHVPAPNAEQRVRDVSRENPSYP